MIRNPLPALHLLFIAAVVCLLSCSGHSYRTKATQHTGNTTEVPLGGNTWRTVPGTNGGSVTVKGIVDWDDPGLGFNTYIRFAQTGVLQLQLHAALAEGTAKLAVRIHQQTKTIEVNKTGFADYNLGSWAISDTGYIAINIQGLSKSGKKFPAIDYLKLAGTAVSETTSFVKNNEGNFFYWGRRGPSVHLNYETAANENIEWFYNEVTVPEGNDLTGSYYMANGFAEGYFGIQVNSATERRVLFSVWSPFQTDDPSAIPADQQIVLVKKGKNVHAGEFGNEGAGGQSYLRFPWKAGLTYGFLLRGVPSTDSFTTYSAWIHDPETKEWMLIASFRRPKTKSWLTHLHSFLENFDPEQGNQTRKVLFGNQWVCTDKGQWIELVKARFTGDNTARVGFRKDYAGGTDHSFFYLRHCGFFNDPVLLSTWFERPPMHQRPDIRLNQLP